MSQRGSYLLRGLAGAWDLELAREKYLLTTQFLIRCLKVQYRRKRSVGKSVTNTPLSIWEKMKSLYHRRRVTGTGILTEFKAFHPGGVQIENEQSGGR